jgi:septal ring factor EnvC (AmiA/AmiB activator)
MSFAVSQQLDALNNSLRKIAGSVQALEAQVAMEAASRTPLEVQVAELQQELDTVRTELAIAQTDLALLQHGAAAARRLRAG